MAEGDLGAVATAKAQEVSGRSGAAAWAALASVWARLFVLVGPGWTRWSSIRATVDEAMAAALGVAAGDSPPESHRNSLVDALDALPIEDDGSAEWQALIDLVSMLQEALRQANAATCLEHALLWYLEGERNVIGNSIAGQEPRHVPAAEIEAEPRWMRAVAFVHGL